VTDPVFRELLARAAEDTARGEEVQGQRKINLATIKVLVELMQNYPDDWRSKLTSGEPLAAVQQFINIYSRPSLTWEDLSFLRERTSLPIILKGIQHPDDARQAVEHGIDGIVVSNHGGRQVDGAIGSFDALEDIVEAVGDSDLTILFDSGIRTGADIFKAIAVGADAVLLGRPWVYGLAVGGEEGVREVLKNFKADFELTMGLAGCKDVSEITPETLRPRKR
jgi:isopentenyl diphosphate isomerase/L-lactate dehydrogenase-like FMN-dependent dehydrogenase